MFLYVRINEQYFVTITMVTEFMQSAPQSHKWDKTHACLSTQCDVIGRDSAVAGVLLFIFCVCLLNCSCTLASPQRASGGIEFCSFFKPLEHSRKHVVQKLLSWDTHTQIWCFNLLMWFYTQWKSTAVISLWSISLALSLFSVTSGWILKLQWTQRDVIRTLSST